MGILPFQTIQAEIAAGRLVRSGVVERIQPSSYDLRIGTIFKDGQIINGEVIGGVTSIVLKPGGVLSMFTLEELVLPPDILATVFPINSQSSRGLLVLNPGHVDPGYDGPITVKVLNISKSEMMIKLGQPIFTAIFERLETATSQPYSVIKKDRTTREIEFAEKDMNVSPGSLVKLVGEPNTLEIEKMIRSHWASRWSIFLTAGALIFAVIAALPVFKDAAQKTKVTSSEIFEGERTAESKESVSSETKELARKPVLAASGPKS
ncbi:MAG: hypothetical protein Q7T87_14995 [Polaromonas sp.]|nr:hypothetical protein [Polaromonas sp.]